METYSALKLTAAFLLNFETVLGQILCIDNTEIQTKILKIG